MYITPDYHNFKYTIEIPKGIEVEAANILEHADNTKTHGVIAVVRGVYKEFVSAHGSARLADKKATQLQRAEPSPDWEYLVVPLTIDKRPLTLFTNDGWFGATDGTAVYDTSKWTPVMWQVIRWEYRAKDKAEHFTKGDHVFDPKTHICTVCFLSADDLGLDL